MFFSPSLSIRVCMYTYLTYLTYLTYGSLSKQGKSRQNQLQTKKATKFSLSSHFAK